MNSLVDRHHWWEQSSVKILTTYAWIGGVPARFRDVFPCFYTKLAGKWMLTSQRNMISHVLTGTNLKCWAIHGFARFSLQKPIIKPTWTCRSNDGLSHDCRINCFHPLPWNQLKNFGDKAPLNLIWLWGVVVVFRILLQILPGGPYIMVPHLAGLEKNAGRKTASFNIYHQKNIRYIYIVLYIKLYI